MHLGKPANNTATRNVRITLGVLALAFIIAFWNEIGDVLSFLWTFFKIVLLRFPYDGVESTVAQSLLVICFNVFIGFGLVFLLWLFLISAQALLPVNNLLDIHRTAWHLWMFIMHRHGPAIFVKDGKMVTTNEDSQRQGGHGVVVVDFNSAVVLEERDVRPGLTRMASRSEINLLNILGLSDPPISPRARGAGIVFTRPNERIRGVVDLRRQFRRQPGISSYTREGIELASNILSIFTIGDDPKADALQVTYTNNRKDPEDWRVCIFRQSTLGEDYIYLSELIEELDPADSHELAHEAKYGHSLQAIELYNPLPMPSIIPRFDADRVFAAVFAQARSNEQEPLNWTELPTRVAAGFFRDLMPRVNYDRLYDINGNGKFPLPDYKRMLRLYMRNNGVLAYRVVYHCSGRPLVSGKDYRKRDLTVSTTHLFKSPKLLRDRGIRVVFGSFGDPIPESQVVYQQRLDSWKAKWEQELSVAKANQERKVMRTRTQALIAEQQDLWQKLSQLFSVRDFSDEALALRLLQALENSSSDPKTSKLLPNLTVEMLHYIHNTLLGSQNAPQIPMKNDPFQ